MWEAAPCSPLPTADENAVQNFLWPPCLPACSSQPQFLQRTCSYDAYCLCPPWSLFHVFFRVWTWLTWWARFLSGLSCALTSVSILRDMTTMELPSLRGCWSHMSVCLRQCQTETIIASENHTHTHTYLVFRDRDSMPLKTKYRSLLSLKNKPRLLLSQKAKHRLLLLLLSQKTECKLLLSLKAKYRLLLSL